MDLGWFLIPAVINGVLTAAVWIASWRAARIGVIVILAVTVIYILSLWLWPDALPTHSRAELLWMSVGLGGVTWLPGSVLAIIGGRRTGWPGLSIGISGVIVGVLMGAGFVYTAVVFACGMFGDCP
jgi:hypothetical protein